MPDVNIRTGTADDSSRGHTVDIEFANRDVLTVEITEERDTVWIQYSEYRNGMYTPRDGHKVEL